MTLLRLPVSIRPNKNPGTAKLHPGLFLNCQLSQPEEPVSD